MDDDATTPLLTRDAVSTSSSSWGEVDGDLLPPDLPGHTPMRRTTFIPRPALGGGFPALFAAARRPRRIWRRPGTSNTVSRALSLIPSGALDEDVDTLAGRLQGWGRRLSGSSTAPQPRRWPYCPDPAGAAVATIHERGCRWPGGGASPAFGSVRRFQQEPFAQLFRHPSLPTATRRAGRS